MARIRMDWVGDAPSVCDIGVGSGEFLREAVRRGTRAFGYDIAQWTPDPGVERVYRLQDVQAHTVTMFDSLEHIHDLSFLATLKAERLVVTVPWCHANDMGIEWFRDWKHRKPDEHVWHFDLPALMATMRDHGWRRCERIGHPEDSIRGLLNGLGNTLTGSFLRL